MAKHLIFDFETLDNRSYNRPVVPSVAFLVFDPEVLMSFDQLVDNSLRIKFDISEQIQHGRKYNQETVDWWRKPDNSEAYKKVIEVDGSEVGLGQLDSLLKEYLIEMEYDPGKGKVWTRGNSFDVPILDNIYEDFGWDPAFSWWNVRDIRTEIDAITPHFDSTHAGYGYIKDFPYPKGFIKHQETHDVSRDVLMMQQAHIQLMTKMGII